MPIADCRLGSRAHSAIGKRGAIGNDVVASRRSFLLRIDPAVLEAVQRWADDDLRSLNGQIEFLLRCALTEAGRTRSRENTLQPGESDTPSSEQKGQGS